MITQERIEELKKILLAGDKEKARLVARYLWLTFIDPEGPGDGLSKITWLDDEDAPSFERLQRLVKKWVIPFLPVESAEELERKDGHFWVYMHSILRDVLYRLGGMDASCLDELTDEKLV